MADLKLIKLWKVIRWHLEQARLMLPTRARENFGELVDHDLASLSEFQDNLDHNELELALDQLEGLGDLNDCPGGFWRNLEKAADLMGLDERAATLHRKFEQALDACAHRGDAN
jgi:hypothetical protein